MKGSHSKKSPLLTTAWHQDSPYNILCPEINGTPTLVGCVAVAMGQICAYHQWPKQLNGYTYDWESMLSQSTHATTYDTGVYDIAHLLREIGESVNMNYGTSESLATLSNALNSFKDMGFNSAKKKDYSINDVKISLNSNLPVLMIGIKSTGKGHAWVVDGYNIYSTWTEYYNKETGELYATYGGAGYTYLHFNIGWEDTENNAYYLCSGIDSDETGKEFSTFGYTSGNKIITDIKL